ncbi:MAG: flavin reductase family protein [Cohaesibacter sp.]|nr:flavin reductase family protein [Cohaesibacter sp.]MCV6602391.1 flavin reductase family protein [Cohaesibacter sp.]
MDGMRLRKAMSQYATGIAVATTLDEDGLPHGLTINSFNSVSLDPPLVLWSLSHKSGNLEAFTQSGHFAINILSQQQKDISMRFATPDVDRFAGTDWQKGKLGSPVLSGVVASMDCKVEQMVEGGDHVIFIGRVVEANHTDSPPLLYHGGAYHSLGPVLD